MTAFRLAELALRQPGEVLSGSNEPTYWCSHISPVARRGDFCPCHHSDDARGHWHSGGYDSAHPGNSQNTMPDGVVAVADQVEWSLMTIRDDVRYLLTEANCDEAANKVDPKLLESALASIKAHLAQAGDMRTKLIAQKLIAA